MNDPGHFIHGKTVSFPGEPRLDVIDPFSGEVVGAVPAAREEAVDSALASAKEALSSWKQTSLEERFALMEAFGVKVEAERDALVDTLVREVGKTVRYAELEVGSLTKSIAYFLEEGRRQLVDTPLRGADPTLSIVRDPLGVVVAITPFNFPLLLFSWKLCPAVLTGCTVVSKPDPRTPLSTALLAAWASEVGFPPGVFNVVHGDGRTGAMLVEDPRVAKVAFTGSVAAGRAVYRAAAGGIKRVTLELGGCSPLVVDGEADVAGALKHLLHRSFYNSGQYCFRINRAYVQRERYDEFLRVFAEGAGRLVVGDPGQPGTDLGPLIDRPSVEQVLERIQQAVDAGARVVLDGRSLAADGGCLLGPTVLADVPEEAEVMRSETFGPVLSVAPVGDLDEALARANGTEYGLAAFGLAGSPANAERLSRELEAGSVWVNALDRQSFDAPFGGIKQSGVGVEKSRWAFDEYLQPRAVYYQPSCPTST